LNQQSGSELVRMLLLVAAVVAAVILVFFVIGYGLGRLLL
jgi:preprotein translocase subunit SecE